jgi:hypothetical protein
MDRDSPESKEVDAALLAQCTCGGVAGGKSCDIECAIFNGVGAVLHDMATAEDEYILVALSRKDVGPGVEQRGDETHYLNEAGESVMVATPMRIEEVKADRAAGKMQHFTEIGAPHVASFDKELVAGAQDLITASLSYIAQGGRDEVAPLTEGNLNLLRMAIDTPKPETDDTAGPCPDCGSTESTESEVEKDSSLFKGEGDDELEIKYKVKLRTCSKCECGWLDWRAEEAEMQALYKGLYKEVVRQRGIAKAYLDELEILQAVARVPPT